MQDSLRLTFRAKLALCCTETLKAQVSPEIKLRAKAIADREFVSEAAWLKRLVLREVRACDGGLASEGESSRDANGVSWLLTTHRELIDAQIVINPGGGEAAIKQGRKLYVAVQTSEKNFLTFGTETTDKGGHSSRPTADNPIYRLATALTRLSQYSFPVSGRT